MRWKARPPQRFRLGPLHQRRKMLFARSRAGWRRHHPAACQPKSLVNSPMAAWIAEPRSAADSGMSTGSSASSLRMRFCVDRVGIAQPVLDLRHPTISAGRVSRGGPWCGLRDRLDLLGTIQLPARNADSAPPASVAAFQRASPANGFEPMQETRGDPPARPPDLAEWLRITSSCPSSLREVMCRQPDAALRQIEAKFIARIGRLSHGSIRGEGGQTPFDQPNRR